MRSFLASAPVERPQPFGKAMTRAKALRAAREGGGARETIRIVPGRARERPRPLSYGNQSPSRRRDVSAACTAAKPVPEG